MTFLDRSSIRDAFSMWENSSEDAVQLPLASDPHTSYRKCEVLGDGLFGTSVTAAQFHLLGVSTTVIL